MSAEVGVSALILKYGGWVMVSIITPFMGYILKEKNDVIKENQKAISDMNTQMKNLETLFTSRDHIIEELTAQVTALSEVKDRVLVMDNQMDNIQDSISEMKKDQKDQTEYLRDLLTQQSHSNHSNH